MHAPRVCAAVLALAVLAGGAARVGTAGWGLPYAFHPDEKGFVVWEAMYAEWRGLEQGDWRPRINTYGPLVYEIAIGVKWLVFGGPARAAEVTARHSSPWEYVRDAFGHTGEAPFSWPMLLWSLRLVSALLGSGAILLLGLAGWKLQGPRTGAWAGVLAASSVGLIQVGHFYTSEALLVFALSMWLHACAWLARGGRWPVSIYAGLALAALAATKLPGLATGLALPVALAASHPSDPHEGSPPWVRQLGRNLLASFGSGRLWLALGIAALAYAGINPWIVTEPQAYLHDVPDNRNALWMASLMEQTEFGFYDWRFPYNDTTPYLYHLTRTLPYALGWPALATAVTALLFGLHRLRPLDRIALGTTLPVLLLVGDWGVKTIRYILPVVPGLVLAAASLLEQGSQLPARAVGVRRFMRPALCWGVGAWTVLYGVAFTAMFTEPDPRIAGARWIAEHAEPGSVVVTEPAASYTVPLGGNRENVGVQKDLQPEVTVRELWDTRPRGKQAIADHLDRRLADARYLVLGEFFIRRATHPAAQRRAPHHHRIYEALRQGQAGFERVATFPRSPRLGPLRWDEDDAELLSVCFDHMEVEIYERTGPFQNPLRTE